MSVDHQQFSGTDQYIATDSLKLAVKAARSLQKPLLVKGEPGTGKTLLAEQVAESLGMKLITWHIKSTTKAQQGLYEYDAVSRLRDSQLGDDRVYDIKNYIKPGKLWEAFTSDERCVLLIDEIDKADIEFPNNKPNIAGATEEFGPSDTVGVSKMANIMIHSKPPTGFGIRLVTPYQHNSAMILPTT